MYKSFKSNVKRVNHSKLKTKGNFDSREKTNKHTLYPDEVFPRTHNQLVQIQQSQHPEGSYTVMKVTMKENIREKKAQKNICFSLKPNTHHIHIWTDLSSEKFSCQQNHHNLLYESYYYKVQ